MCYISYQSCDPIRATSDGQSLVPSLTQIWLKHVYLPYLPQPSHIEANSVPRKAQVREGGGHSSLSQVYNNKCITRAVSIMVSVICRLQLTVRIKVAQ